MPGTAYARYAAATTDVFSAASLEIDANRLRSTVSETLIPTSAENLRRAHALLECGQAKGKITLSRG